MKKLLSALLGISIYLIAGHISPVKAAEADIYCQSATPGANGGWGACSTANPLPTTAIGVEQADITGTFTNATQTTSVTSATLDGYGTLLLSINGTYNTATAVFEASDDAGTTWYPLSMTRSDNTTGETGYTGLTNTSRAWLVPTGAIDLIRVRSTAVGSGTVNVRISVSSVPGASGAGVIISNYPAPAATIVAVGTGTTGAVSATLAANATLRTFICGFDVSAIGGVATIGPITITNVSGATFTYQIASTATGNLLSKTFSPCLPTSAVNTSMVITTTADGTASAVDVNAWGYQAP